MELDIEPDNVASRGVARNAGFVEEGLLRKQDEAGDERRDMPICSRLPSDASNDSSSKPSPAI
jgi:RimJ/RimL family protein N-acetyltransferase